MQSIRFASLSFQEVGMIFRAPPAEARNPMNMDGEQAKKFHPYTLLLNGLRFRSVGAALGRTTELALYPAEPARLQFATTSGGEWKFTNAVTIIQPPTNRESSYTNCCILLSFKFTNILRLRPDKNFPGLQ
jgi:hypothetical protein